MLPGETGCKMNVNVLFHIFNFPLTIVILFSICYLAKISNGDKPKIIPWLLVTGNWFLFYGMLVLRDMDAIHINNIMYINIWSNIIITQALTTILGITWLEIKRYRVKECVDFRQIKELQTRINSIVNKMSVEIEEFNYDTNGE